MINDHAASIFLTLIDSLFFIFSVFLFSIIFSSTDSLSVSLSVFLQHLSFRVPFRSYSIIECCALSRWHNGFDKIVVGKRKFDGGHQNPGDPKRRYASGLILGNGGNNWGSQPLPQQPLGANGEQWYTDTYAAWS